MDACNLGHRREEITCAVMKALSNIDYGITFYDHSNTYLIVLRANADQVMDKRPVDVFEDNSDKVVRINLQRSPIGGKGVLISCFHKIPSATWLILPRSFG